MIELTKLSRQTTIFEFVCEMIPKKSSIVARCGAADATNQDGKRSSCDTIQFSIFILHWTLPVYFVVRLNGDTFRKQKFFVCFITCCSLIV